LKKYTIFSFLIIILAFSVVYGQGFSGPGAGSTSGAVQTVTVSEAKTLPDNTLVTLTGNIVASLSREKFTFRDSTGDITIEVDRNLWVLLDVSVGAHDRVEIRGELDVEKRITEVDVKFIRKI
jgi:uncharacterized protein (TIGR00156 family)